MNMKRKKRKKSFMKMIKKNNITNLFNSKNIPTSFQTTNITPDPNTLPPNPDNFSRSPNMNFCGKTYLTKNKVFFGPSKACNAGGVSVSGLEMIQNSSKIFWNKEEIDAKLRSIMGNIFYECIITGQNYKEEDDLLEEILIIGSNISGFLKISNAMKEQGYFY